MQKIAAFIVKKRKLLLVVMLALAGGLVRR